MITPMEIHNREFKKGFRGYNENEVDEFLDRVVVDYEKVLRENEKLRDKLVMNDKEVENYRKLEKNLQDTLSVAQKTSDEILESAKKSAKELHDNAVREAKSIYNNTMLETQNIREQAKLESKRLLDDASHRLKIIITEYEKIVREKNSFLLKIRTALESELAVTSQLLTSVPHIDEIATLKTELTKIETAKQVLLQDKVDKKNYSQPVQKFSAPEIHEPREFLEKVSQVVSKPKADGDTEKISDAEPEQNSVPEKIPEPKATKISLKPVENIVLPVAENKIPPRPVENIVLPVAENKIPAKPVENIALPVAENKIPEPQKISDADKNSELEDTKFIEKFPDADKNFDTEEQISDAEDKNLPAAEKNLDDIDDFDKTMVFKPIKKPVD